MGDGGPAQVPLNLVRGCLLATSPPELTPESLDALRSEVLERARATGARRILLDFSAVQLMDAEDFAALRRLVAAASLMGARTIVAGLQAGVVASLVELGVECDSVVAALDVDDGFSRLEASPRAERDPWDAAPDEEVSS